MMEGRLDGFRISVVFVDDGGVRGNVEKMHDNVQVQVQDVEEVTNR